MAADTPLLDVRNLAVTFSTEAGPVRAVDGVSFTVEAGQVFGIVGESGSGKTVSLLSVIGLLGKRGVTMEGSIRLNGRELIGLSEGEMRAIRGREIAMIFQDPMTAMTPVYSVGTQIIEQIRVHEKLSKKAARDRAIELLAAVGIPNPKAAVDRYPHELSGGMRQRAMIAMALSCNPSIILADEPTTALDVTVQAQILDLLLKLREDFNSAIVLITHDMGVIAEIADRVVVMYAGRIVESGEKDALLYTPRHPYTQGLLTSIPPLEGERLHRLPSIGGTPPSLLRLPPGCAFAPRCAYVHDRCISAKPVLTNAPHAYACFREVTP
ncbi:ABC transporter ATP-binding protein [Allorhizobium sp. BGMRC 0089]|uniref:ABC transporter ATP-binding protein n=1 Tax=Allorhizobium sonneratiae TaxID=2934936 RepID=UPI002034771D|nr:ABC transporter ATP-binding protein [Allorhizobium sonneratiae]MCM2293131.1 ABC transporter ATP-binding protein [Allorhizobium sonneratiae]